MPNFPSLRNTFCGDDDGDDDRNDTAASANKSHPGKQWNTNTNIRQDPGVAPFIPPS